MSDNYYYDILGVSVNATTEEIQMAYWEFVNMYNPNVNNDPDTQLVFKEIQEAYEVLSDPNKRMQYDAGYYQSAAADQPAYNDASAFIMHYRQSIKKANIASWIIVAVLGVFAALSVLYIIKIINDPTIQIRTDTSGSSGSSDNTAVTSASTAGSDEGERSSASAQTSENNPADTSAGANGSDGTSGNTSELKVVSFGKFNGEELKWIVLEENENEMLVLCGKAVAMKQYNDNYQKGATWAKCTLHKWLNNTFYKNAFSKDEQARIVKTTVKTPDNTQYETKGGKESTDKVFLLSYDEFNKYLTNDSLRKASALDSVDTSYQEYNGYINWWLRTPGSSSLMAIAVNRVGEASMDGDYQYGTAGVRPAMWIKKD